MQKILASYTILSDGVPAEVTIVRREEEYVDSYDIRFVVFQKPTQAVINHIKERIIEDISLKTSDMLDLGAVERAHEKFVKKAGEMLEREMLNIRDVTKDILVGTLVHDLIGLGDLEMILADENLEEVVINTAKEPVWVYHKKFGWLKTNYYPRNEDQVQNFASIIARKVGRQVNTLNPLLDAHLMSGDRANATLHPISSKGNAIVIRKFAKNPWTVTNLIPPLGKTISLDVAALLWMAMQYEMNVIVAGGTASGKTSILNALLIFIPPNQRVLSIEDTRELYLPPFLHWCPMVTRMPNPEGKGEVTMLDLLVNSLRMRPDRIVVGEIRRQKEAEVLFEAMHTGHSVYATIHADNAEQVVNRMITPPINLPETQLRSVHLVLVQYRQRRSGLRRTFEVAELLPTKDGVSVNKLYQWNAKTDSLDKVGEPKRILDELSLYSGLSPAEILKDLKEKKSVLEWMSKNKVTDIDDVGKVIAVYYRNKDLCMGVVNKNKPPVDLVGVRLAGEKS